LRDPKSTEHNRITLLADRSSKATAEPNDENRVKIRPVEVEIIGLTGIVKKKKDTEAKRLATR